MDQYGMMGIMFDDDCNPDEDMSGEAVLSN